MAMKTLLSFFILFLFIPSIQAQTIVNFTILPQSPTNFTPVKIATYITTGNVSLFISKSFTVNSQQNIIQLEACYYMSMANAFGQYVDTFAVGNLNPGNYTILFKLIMSSTPGSCTPGYTTSATENFTVSQTATSLRENNTLNVISIYPNPVKDMLILEHSGSIAPSCCIRNALGEIVFEQGLVKPGHGIDMTPFAPGIYFVELKSTAGSKRVKVVKE
jgi:hypothetical protein